MGQAQAKKTHKNSSYYPQNRLTAKNGATMRWGTGARTPLPVVVSNRLITLNNFDSLL
jgi:hypothetical protein